MNALNKSFYIGSIVFLVTAVMLCSGCGYAIKYRLNDANILKANAPIPMKIQVAEFSDDRDAIEREKSARKAQGFADAGDYTYDKEFKGDVAEGVTTMLVAHLEYAGTFSGIAMSRYSAKEISDDVLKQLNSEGVDAVLVGSLQNFYGFYDSKPGKQAAYGLGLGLALGIPVAFATTKTETKNVGFARFEETTVNPLAISLATSLGSSMGFYLESTGQRNTEGHAKLSVKLLSTANREALWQDSFEIHPKEFRAMPGFNTQQRKYELAVWSLRDAVNEMVKSLSDTALISGKN